MTRCRLIFIVLLLCLRLQAQWLQPAMFDHYAKADGLSDNVVRGIAEDSTGFLWIGTLWGFNRFNGDRFIQYNSGSDSASMPFDDVYNMGWLDEHRLGIYGMGLHIVDTRNGERKNLFVPYHDKKYQFKFNMIMKATGDKDGNIYMLGRSGFYHFNKLGQLVFRFDYYAEKDVPVHHFIFGGNMVDIDAGRLLLISSGGLYVYDKVKSDLKKISAAEFPLLAETMDYPDPPFEFLQIHPGEYFIFKTNADSLLYVNLNRKIKTYCRLPIHTATEIAWRSKLLQVNDTLFYITSQLSGLYAVELHKTTGKITFHQQKQLDEFVCNSITKDKENRILIGTNKGFLRQRLYLQPVETAWLPQTIRQKFANIKLNNLYAGTDKVYVATRQAGLAVFDKQTLAFEKNILFTQFGEPANNLTSVTKIDAEHVLLGGSIVPLYFNTRLQTAVNLLPPQWKARFDWTSDQLNDGHGNIWISSQNTYRWNLSSKKFTVIPQLPQLLSTASITAVDNTGNIWFGRHGIARYNITAKKYDLYLDSFPFIKIPDKQVKAIIVDKQNRVWFTSDNNGLIVYDLTKKTFRHFTSKDGLPDNMVYALIETDNKIWAACYSGIACVDIDQLKVTGFGKEDGFPSSTIESGVRFFYDTLQQQLYISYKDAVVRFKPGLVLQKKMPPKVFIESVLLNGKELHYLPKQTIHVSWKNKELAVTIGSINFFDGATQRYAYRMADKDSVSWTDLGKKDAFSISNLSPGQHRLQVKVYSAGNRWPQQIQELEIIVSPPFWLQAWFITAIVLLLVLLVYYFVRWRAAAARKKEMVNTQMQKLRAEDYKAQFELEQVSNYFSSSLADKKDADEVLWDVAANLIGRMNYEDCVIYVWNENKTKMLQKAAYGPKGKPEVILKDAFEVAPGQGIVGEVIITKKPLLVKDTRQDKRYRIDDEFRLSELAVPIIHNDELLGVIDSENSQVNYFSERDIKMLTTIATLIGNKLKQIESERSLEAKKEELAGINEQLAEARLSALQTQMNPHFVFNALNSIKRMILDADNEKASRYLSKFALMIRMTLEHSKETFVTLQDNIQYLKAYLEMEKLRFDDRFTYSIDTDEQADVSEVMLPSMMIQPLVENAIWHGLMYSDSDKKLSISFILEQQRVVCIIEDNGIGIRQSEQLRQQHRPMHRSVGLGNLQNRIKIMNEKYNTNCRLEIIDLKEAGSAAAGTRAVLSFNQIKM